VIRRYAWGGLSTSLKSQVAILIRRSKMEISKEQTINMYEPMVRIRRFEEKIEELVNSAIIGGFVHLYIGEEAVAAGVCANLKVTDYITSTHRGHGHLIAKGGDVKLMMAELFGKSTGYCKGKGGSMHIADLDLGILGANGIVGGGPPIAVGAALTAKYKKTDNVSIAFFGDGASNQGTVHEAMNLASVFQLPVVFVVENNGYGEYTCQADHQCIESVTERAQGYGIPGVDVDGNDVMAVYEAASEAIDRARKGKGPSILACKTYRTRGHFIGDPQTYRDEAEVKTWQTPEKDPILRFKKQLLTKKIMTEKEVEDLEASVQKEIDDAVEFAKESPDPQTSDLMTDVYAD
jgi:acetoin:2,6-dichlorophenolindophenol oxidoreductase subunit alpha